jgi:uncharacterized protein with GYD domain
MPTYITLYNWTQKGIESVKDSPERLDAAKAGVEAMGGKVLAFYMVQGRFDMVVISEAPDDETGAKIALALGSKGSVRSETLRAYNEDEYRKIVSELP